MSWMTSALVVVSFVSRPRLITGKACDDGDDTRGTCGWLAIFADVHAKSGTYRLYDSESAAKENR
ncbi:hypothetical protein EJB05_40054 [Eragrostis curvula]|uniref:Secreted protein n=1 Tax=Eragrostis curvula TaxID=38414 RepID=A0A5J9TYR7_9POAL|nr:hypothetical protein EJB05_40054 [Eragrostis curvula]